MLVSVDTLRADHLPAYGFRGVETPHLDAFRRDALLVADAYSQVPLTLPSHASLLTGRFPAETGVRDNAGFTLGEKVPTLAGVLRAAGYETGAAVSSIILTGETGISRGFDFYDDSAGAGNEERDGAQTSEKLLAWVAPRRDRPFFAFLHINEPHAPYAPPEPWKTRYAAAPYDGEIARSDEIVGHFLDRLREWGIYDRALVIFLSDHGEGLGDHGEREHGIFLYREAIRVPLLVKFPGGRDRGSVARGPAALVDVFPTVLRAAGLAVPGGLPGRALAAGGAEAGERRIVSETLYPRLRLGWSDLASLVDGRYHYIEAPRPELYDLSVDPGEKNDLSAGKPPAFRSMRVALAAIPRPLAAPADEANPERARKLASLGYLSATSPDWRRTDLPDPKDRISRLEQAPDFARLLREKRDPELIAAARHYLASSPAVLDVWRLLAQALERTGRRAEAIAALEEGLKNSPTTLPARRIEALEQLTSLLILAGRGDEALRLADPSAFTNPQVLNAVGVLQAERGDLGGGRSTLERALALAPEDAQTNRNLGTVLLRAGDAAGARRRLEKAVALEPGSGAAWNSLGVAQARAGDERAALESWRRASDSDAKQYDALFNLAIGSFRAGRAEAGRSALERFVASAPADRYAEKLAQARRILRESRPGGS